MRRDGNQIRQNDNFGVVLDTFYDRRNGINLYANPLGGMMDIQITNEGNNNQDWNTIWDARTARFDGGWSIELQDSVQVAAVPAGRAGYPGSNTRTEPVNQT